MKYAPQERAAHAAGSEDCADSSDVRKLDANIQSMRDARPSNGQACCTVKPFKNAQKH